VLFFFLFHQETLRAPFRYPSLLLNKVAYTPRCLGLSGFFRPLPVESPPPFPYGPESGNFTLSPVGPASDALFFFSIPTTACASSHSFFLRPSVFGLSQALLGPFRLGRRLLTPPVRVDYLLDRRRGHDFFPFPRIGGLLDGRHG